MRKLKLQVQISIDGFIAGPNGEMDWMAWNWGEDIGAYVTALTAPVDTIVLGRKLAEGFIPYWDAAANGTEPVPGADKMSSTPKVVFTTTLTEHQWPLTTLAHNLAEDIAKLKASEGGDIIAYGGANFVSNLIKEGLVDEFFLFVNPAALGTGMPIFAALTEKQPLQLKDATAFSCGITVLHYTK
jgi:dihydrofolate reductase